MLKSLFIRKNKEYSQYSFGDFSYGQPNVVAIDSQGKLKVGKFCQFGGGVLIMLNSSGGHRPEWVTTYPFTQFFDDFKNLPFPTAKKLDVTIGNDVWIGTNSTILSGVNIGDGAIIEAFTL